jgi:hypothetical protein
LIELPTPVLKEKPQGLVTIFIFLVFRVLGKKIKIVTSPCGETSALPPSHRQTILNIKTRPENVEKESVKLLIPAIFQTSI